jgi:hypothetical protein
LGWLEYLGMIVSMGAYVCMCICTYACICVCWGSDAYVAV